MGNLFDQMATQNQNGTTVAQAPSQAPTPQPVVSPATDQQKPQTFDASAVAPGATFHGTADEAQNLFTQMAQQEQARKNQGQPAPHVTNKPTPPRIGGAGGSWFDDQSKTGSDTFNWINKATEKAYATVGKAIPDWATTPLAAETKYVAKPIDAVGDWITERGKEAGEAPADFITGMKNKDYDQVAKAIAHYVAPEAAKWTKMSPEQQKRAAESHPWMYGIGGGVGEFSGGMLSPVNLAIMVAMPEEKAFPLLSKVLKAGFASQMSAQAMAQVADLAHNWGDMSQADKIRALTELPLNVGTLVWGSLMGKKGEGKFNPETGDKKTLLRPTTKTIAGVPRDITASQQEGAGRLTNFFTHEAELPGMKSPSDLQQDTRPQGTKQAVSVLSQRATDKINAHDAIVNGGKAPAEITGTQTPGKHVSPDQIWQAMQESANQTYDKARSVSEKEQSDWKTTRDQAEQDHRASIERQNADIDAHNADPDNEPKIDRIEYNENDLNLPERPKTYDELKKDIDNARDRLSKLNDTDDREKARTVDLPKAEKAMDDWFKNHEDAISPNEYQSAKDLWSDSMKFRTIADKLRRKIDTGTLTGNAIRALKSDINGEAIKRRGAAGDGTFQRLMGQEATENLEQVAKLFDPLEPTDPRKAGFKSWGLLAAHHLVSTLLIPFFGHFVAAGEAARLGMDMLLNHVMFDPEFGKSFSTFAEAVKNSAATGAEVPAAALQGVKERLEGIANRYRRSKFSGEEGAVGAAVKKRTVGPDAGARPLNPGADMRTAGANYAEDLKAQQQAKEERDNGTLPEGVSFLQRAQQLKEQFVKAKEEPTSNHVTRAADAYNKAVGRPAVDTANSSVGGVPFSVPLDFSKENAPTTASKDNSDSEISTRYPTATGADASRNPSKASDWAAIQEADRLSPTRQSALGKTVLGYKEKLARTVAEYTGMFPDDATRLEALKNPDKVLSKFVNHVSDNLEWIYNQIPDEIKSQTRQWYDAASRMLDERAQKYGYSHEQTAGVTAALSPQNPWDNNLGLADRMMDAYRNQQNHPYTEEMESKAAELRKVPTQSGAFKKMLRDINGKKLSEIRNANKDVEAAQKALWIRLYDEAHGSESNPEYSPTGEVVGHGSSRSWVGLDHMMKAVKILENGDVSNINEVMGQGHKIRNFYNNLINPNSKNGHVTIDTHAVSAGLLSPLGAKDTEPMHNFGNSTKGIPGAPRHAATGLKGSYPLYAEAYQKTAQKLGIQPRELQSIVWEGIKSLMGDDKKTSDLKSRVKEIWQDVASGKLEPQEAREKIKEASYGFAKPAWMADEAWEKLGNEGEDTGFDTKAMAATQHQMISVGGETHGITADINPPSANPELKGAPRPSSTDYERFADWANANAHPEHVLTITAHELAHAFVQHLMEIPTSGMKIGLGHRAIYEGKPLGEGLGPAPMTGVSGGFVSPGGDWARAAEQASHEGKQPEFLQKYTTQLMAGRAMEEMLGVDPTAAKVHTSGDVSMARQALEQSGVPREKIGLLLEDATEKAKQILQSNWGTLQHMTRQAVNHFGGDLLDSGHFHKYRNGGVYGQP